MFWDGVIDSIIFVIKLFTLYWMLQCIIFWLRGREKGHLISLLAAAAPAQVELFGREGEGIFIGNSWKCSSERNFWSFLSWSLLEETEEKERNIFLWLLREFYGVMVSQKPCWEFLAWVWVCRKGSMMSKRGVDWPILWFSVSPVHQDSCITLRIVLQ